MSVLLLMAFGEANPAAASPYVYDPAITIVRGVPAKGAGEGCMLERGGVLTDIGFRAGDGVDQRVVAVYEGPDGDLHDDGCPDGRVVLGAGRLQVQLEPFSHIFAITDQVLDAVYSGGRVRNKGELLTFKKLELDSPYNDPLLSGRRGWVEVDVPGPQDSWQISSVKYVAGDHGVFTNPDTGGLKVLAVNPLPAYHVIDLGDGSEPYSTVLSRGGRCSPEKGGHFDVFAVVITPSPESVELVRYAAPDEGVKERQGSGYFGCPTKAMFWLNAEELEHLAPKGP